MILVTGGTGLVGSHLLFQLTSLGNNVRALKRETSDTGLVHRLFKYYSQNPQNLLDKIEWVDGDIDDNQFISKSLEGIKEIYHCAALVSFNDADNKAMLNINAEFTANLVDAGIAAGVEKFCHVSSVAVLGESDGNITDENTQWGKTKGKSGYAISKFRGEMEVWRGYELGMKTVIFMPSIIIGPGKWHGGSGNLLGTLSKGFPFYTTGVTGYVDARDVARCMIAGMDKGLWGKRYLLNSENISYKDLFSLAAKEFGNRAPFIPVKPWMGYLALPFIYLAGVITCKSPALTRNTLRSGYKKTYYSSKLAQDELGINFIPIAQSVSNAIKAGSL